MAETGTFELPDTIEAIEFYYEQGLTDGLPVVPPTPERVQQFLDCAGLKPDKVLGTRPSMGWVLTAQKVAINAVMAGCRPEYMPVVAAAVEAYTEPEFNGSAIVGTTGHSTPMVIVNGPVRNQLHINSGWNLFGPGWRANATIGRALRLVLMNVCGVVPGQTDFSIFGQPGRYTSCIAEAEELSPWEPLHVERGFSLEDSTVTIVGADPFKPIGDHASTTAEGILDTLGDALGSIDYGFGQVVVIIGPQHLEVIAGSGISKRQVQEYLLKRANSRRPILIPEKATEWMLKVVGRSPSVLADPSSPAGRMGISEDGSCMTLGPAEDILLMVGGGAGSGYSAIVPIWSGGWHTGRAVTKLIRPATPG